MRLPFDVQLTATAAKYYRKAQPKTQERLLSCFLSLKKNPFYGETQHIKPLEGYKGLFRYRVGDLRVVFKIDKTRRIVTIIAILHSWRCL